MARKPLFDAEHPFFRPLITRLIVTGFTTGWTVFEFIRGAPIWGLLFGAIAAWCWWALILKYKAPDEGDDDG